MFYKKKKWPKNYDIVTNQKRVLGNGGKKKQDWETNRFGSKLVYKK